MNNINRWEVRKGFLQSGYHMIRAYEARTTNTRAVLMHRSIIDLNRLAYKEVDNKLKNNTYGIYFLFNSDDSGNIEIYVGQSHKGLDRIYQHVKLDDKNNQSYKNWEYAIYIYSEKFSDLTQGVVNALESLFIEQLNKFSSQLDSSVGKMIVHNKKLEQNVDTMPEDPTSYVMYWSYINEMFLNSDIGILPTVELRKAYNDFVNSIYSEKEIGLGFLKNIFEFTIEQNIVANTDNIKQENSEDLYKKYNELLNRCITDSGVKIDGRLYNSIAERFANDGKGKSKTVVTPDGTKFIHDSFGNLSLVKDEKAKNIVDEMLELIPDENLYNDAKILCLYSKDGAFPAAILRKAIRNMKYAPGNRRLQAISVIRKLMLNKIYIVTPSLLCYYNTLEKVLLTYISLMDDIAGKMWMIDSQNLLVPKAIIINGMDNKIKTADSKKLLMEQIEAEFEKFDREVTRNEI